MTAATPSDFHPRERKLVAAFPAYLATHLRADRLGNERRARELCEDLRALTEQPRPETRRAFGGGMGAGGFPARRQYAASRFDPTKLAGCVLDVDIAETGSFTTVSSDVVAGSVFISGSWNRSGCNVTSDALAAPDGSTTADTVTVSGATPGFYQSLVAPTKFTFYAKYHSCQWMVLMGDGGSTDTLRSTFFDVQNGAVGTIGSIFTGASITDVGDGWYRCEATKSKHSGTSSLFGLFLSTADTVRADPVVGSKVHLWGASIEQLQVSSIVNRASGVTWSQATAAQRPGYYLETRAAMVFGGAQYIVSAVGTESALVAAGTNAAPYSLFIAATPLIVDISASICGFASNSVSTMSSSLWGQSNTLTGRWIHIVNNDSIAVGSVSNAVTVVAAAQVIEWYSDTTGTMHYLQLDGAAPSPNGTTLDPGTLTPTVFGIGARVDTGPDGFFVGALAAVSYYSRRLDTAERSYVRTGTGNRSAIIVTP